MAPRVEVREVGVWKKVNPILDHEGRRRIRVGTRYQVTVQICEGMVSDGMWVTLTHAARIADKAKAERLADSVRKAMRNPAPDTFEGLNLKHWLWWSGPTNAFTALQQRPTAVEYDVD